MFHLGLIMTIRLNDVKYTVLFLLMTTGSNSVCWKVRKSAVLYRLCIIRNVKQITLKKHSVAYLKTHQSVLLNEHLSYTDKRKVEMGTQRKKNYNHNNRQKQVSTLCLNVTY